VSVCVNQVAFAASGWLVGGGTDPESAAVLAEYQKKIADAVAVYEENIWRELEPEVALQLTQTEAEVKKLAGMLQVLRDEIDTEKRTQEDLLREFRAQALAGVQYLPGVTATLGRSASGTLPAGGTEFKSRTAATLSSMRASSYSHLPPS
jgi:hypothetical protein